MTSTEYYSKRTVSELRAMLAVAGIQTSTRTRKADLVTYVVNMLDQAHDSAIEYAETHYVGMGDPRLVKAENVANAMAWIARKAKNYKRQNGSDKLTPKQARRIRKNTNKVLASA